MPREDRIEAEAREIAEAVWDRVARLRELRTRGLGDRGRLDARLGKSQGYYSRLFKRMHPRAETERDRERRAGLSVRQVSRVLRGIGLDPRKFFRRFLGFDLDLYLRELALQKPGQLRSVSERLRRTAPMDGSPEEIALVVEGLETERLRDPAAAETACYQVLAALEEKDEPGRESEAWGVLAAILRKWGRYSAAAYALRRSLESAERSGRRGVRARMLERASYLLADQGDFEPAIEQAEAAYLLYARKLDLPGMGRALVDLGLLTAKTGDSVLAIDYYEASLEFLPKDACHSRFAALQGLGVEYVTCGQLDKGSQRLEEALEALGPKEAKNPGPRNQAQWLAAEIALRQDKLNAAESGLRSVRSSYLEFASPLDIALVSVRLAKVLFLAAKLDDLRSLMWEMQALITPLEKENRLLGAAFAEFLRIAASGKLTARLLDAIYQKLRAGAPADEAPPLPL